MTDEERARSMLGVLRGSVIEDKHTYLLAAIAIVRAEEREKCAKVADIIEATARTVIQIPWSYLAACTDVAAAIRAMGDKG